MIKWFKSFFRKQETLPRRLFTSDLHFGHNNVRFYCDRPWASKDEMNEGLVKLVNEQLNDGDELNIIGDFSLSPKVAKKYAELIRKKKVTLILWCGNHDAPWGFDVNRKAAHMKEKYLNEFNDVRMTGTIVLKNGQEVLLSHLPYANESQKERDSRYWDKRPEDKGLVLLHGHLHCKYVKDGRCIDVGIDNNFKLYSEDDIIKLINDKREFIPSRLTEFYKTRPKKEGMKGENGPD